MDWKIFTDANSSEKASKVLQKTIAQLAIKCTSEKVEPYHKGGFVCSFKSVHEVSSWSQLVFEGLSSAQKIGRGWVVSGNVSDELDIWSNDSLIPGIQNVHLVAINNCITSCST